MTSRIETIQQRARECAEAAMEQGLTADHLTAGWGLQDGDSDYISDGLDRLTHEEWIAARKAYVKAVR